MQRNLVSVRQKVGGAISQVNKNKAIEDLQRGVKIFEELSAADPNNAKARREVGYAYFLIGNVLTEMNDYPAALESRLKAFTIRQETAGQDPKNQQAQFDFAVAYADLAEAYINTDEAAKGFEQAQKSLEILKELSASDPNNAVYLRNIGYCYERLAQAKTHFASDGKISVAQRAEQWTEGSDWYQKALAVFLNLKNQDKLIPADAEKIDKFSAKITDCQDAVARLNHPIK